MNHPPLNDQDDRDLCRIMTGLQIGAIIGLAVLILLFSGGCFPVPVDARVYADRIQKHDAPLYDQSAAFARLADERAYADPTTRPYADPAVIDSHLESIEIGRELQKSFEAWANPKP